MTISDTATKFRYEGNGTTDTFAFSGKAFTAADLVVELITRATDVLAETLTITTDYTVTIATNGTASIVTETAKIPTSLQDIQIRRDLAKTQTTVLPTGTKFPAKSVETAIDRAVGITQDLNEAVTRSLKFPVTSSTTVAALPEPVDDTVLAFDGTTGLFKRGATNASLVAGAADAATSASNASTSASNASTSATLASQWATLTSGQVASTDYSSKAYAIGGTGVTNAAGAAKEWATKAEDSTVDGTLFSALHYSAKASDSADAAAASAAGVNLPDIEAGDATRILKVNSGETGYELAAKLPDFTASKRGAIVVQNDADDGFEILSDQGTTGQVLLSGGANALPTWGASSPWVLLETQTASTSATIDFTSGIDDTYTCYAIQITDLLPATDIVDILMTLSVDGGSNYLSSNYAHYTATGKANSATLTGEASNGDTSIPLTSDPMGNAAGESLSGLIYISNPASTARYKIINYHIGYFSSSPLLFYYSGSATYQGATTAINAIRFAASSGNITSGTFKLYGIS